MLEQEKNDENRFINEIMMIRPSENRVILVVEGKDDIVFLKHHIIPERVRIMQSGGKTNALAAAKYAYEKNMTGIFFLVDLDYDELTVFEKNYPLAIFSKSHDLFMDLLIANMDIMCRVIMGALVPTLGSDKDEPDCRQHAVKTFTQAVDLSSRLVDVRIASHKNSLNLKLENFPFGKLSSSTPSCDEIAEIIQRQSDTHLNVGDIEKLVGKSMYAEDSVPSPAEIEDILKKIGDHDFVAAVHKVFSCSFPAVEKFPRKHFRNSFLTMIPCETLENVAWIYLLKKKLSKINYEIFSCPNCFPLI